MESRITFTEQKHFNYAWKKSKNIYDTLPLLLGLPAGAAAGAVAYFGMQEAGVPEKATTLVALISAGVVIYLIGLHYQPFFINKQAVEYFQGSRPGFICQITFSPRRWTGFEATLDDADDFGVVRFESGGILFQGDSTDLFVLKEDIEEGGSFSGPMSLLYGKRVGFALKAPLSGVYGFTIAVRDGKSVLESRSISREFIRQAGDFLS